MKYITCFWLLILFCVTQGFSQSDFKTGYIIHKNNDTTYGFLAYNGNMANARKCLFKLSEDSGIQEYTPEMLVAYRFTGSKFYISKTIEVDSITTPLFLEFIINGIVDIYYYRDQNGEHYLAEDETGQIIELRNEEKDVIRNNTTYRIESKEYIGALKYIFRQSPEISDKTGAVTLSHKSLINITKDYHDAVCMDKECIIYERKPTKARLTFGPVLGLQLIKATPKDDQPYDLYYFENCTFDLAYSINAGLFLKVNIPYFNERLFFHYEGTYSSYTLHAESITMDDIPFFININDVMYECHNFNNTGMFRYEFRLKKINPVVIGGLYYNYSFNADYIRNLEVQHITGTTYMQQSFSNNPFANEESGFVLGMGLSGKIKKHRECYLDFKYQRGFGINPYINMNYIILDVGIHIGK